MQAQSNETIAAIATPPGPGGISILRLSGPQALSVLQKLFRPVARGGSGQEASGNGPDGSPFAFRPRYMHYGRILDRSGAMLDEALAVYMPAPHSFTGEDVAELHCHGGAGVSAAVLEAAQEAGARPARPGEFSRRAFLNGKLDLAQAEAIAEMISAPGREGVRLAAAKLDGALSRRIASLRAGLDALRMQVILAVDFPDEDAELLSTDLFSRTIRDSLAAIDGLLLAYERARLWREGALAVLVGEVNAGKSSLLNAMLGRERAIVSPQPGTTRDYIEESVNIHGLMLRLVDTAGLRQGGDLVEEEGIRRSRDLAEEADLLLFVTRAGSPLSAEEREFLRRQKDRVTQGRLLLLINKIDLQAGFGDESFARALPSAEQPAGGGREDARITTEALLQDMGLDFPVEARICHLISAKRGWGLERLAAGIHEALTGQGSAGKACLSDAPALEIAPNIRQSGLLRQARDELGALAEALELGYPPDVLSVHLEAAMAFLDEITGSPDNMELMDRIFADFCIGK